MCQCSLRHTGNLYRVVGVGYACEHVWSEKEEDAMHVWTDKGSQVDRLTHNLGLYLGIRRAIGGTLPLSRAKFCELLLKMAVPSIENMSSLHATAVDHAFQTIRISYRPTARRAATQSMAPPNCPKKREVIERDRKNLVPAEIKRGKAWHPSIPKKNVR